jgi:predicted DNA-binding transcriptional regulator AlpA
MALRVRADAGEPYRMSVRQLLRRPPRLDPGSYRARNAHRRRSAWKPGLEKRGRQLDTVTKQVEALTAALERLAALVGRELRPAAHPSATAPRAREDGRPVRLGISELEARLGVNRKTIASWYKAVLFPVPHYLGEMRRWWVHEIEAWEAVQTAPGRPRRKQVPR